MCKFLVINLGLWITAGAASAHAGHAELLAMMADYETARAALAADDVTAALTAAKKLGASAQKAHAAVVAKLKSPVGGIAKAAEAMAKTEPDAGKVRLAFGELSKQLVAYLGQDPGVARDFTVFECPMAMGYGKWVQKSDKLSNPYMGKAMLECGTKSTL